MTIMYWVVSIDQRCIVAGSFNTELEALEWIGWYREKYGKSEYDVLIVDKDEYK